MAYIPTAANGSGWGSWKDGGSWNIIQTLGMEITLVQLEDFRDESVIEQLKGKDILWMGGGQCGYLMYWMRRTQLDIHLKELLDEGALYVGSSAGSMVTAKDMRVSEWYIGENEHGAGAIPGLGLVDFDIYPHFRDELYEDIQNHYQGNKLYLLKDGEYIIVEDGQVKVGGEERIIVKS